MINTENKIDELVKKYDNDTLTRAEIINAEKEIENYPKYWMNFYEKNNKKLFIETIENDEKFKPIIDAVKDADTLIIKKQEFLPLREATKNLDELGKFMAMAYIACTKGILEHENSEPILVFTSEAKSDNEYRDFGTAYYRISNHSQGNSREISRTFNIEDKFHSWDGETAIDGPGEDTGAWNLKWKSYVDSYLLNKGALTETPTEIKNKLTRLVNIAKKLTELELKDDELKKYLGVTNLFKSYDKIEDNAEILKKFDPKNGIKNEDCIAILEDKGGPSSDRGWDVKINSSKISILSNGKLYSKQLPPNYKYEDFPGGQTYYYDELKLEQILSVEKDNKNFVVTAKNQEGKICTYNLQRDLTSELTNRVENIIKEKSKDWLNYNNVNPIPLNMGKEGNEGTYPYSIDSKVNKDNAYISVVRVIDAERYSSAGIEKLFSPQLKIEAYKISYGADGKEKIETIGDVTTQMYRNLPLPCFLDKGEKKIGFSIKPEIIQKETGSVGVILTLLESEGLNSEPKYTRKEVMIK